MTCCTTKSYVTFALLCILRIDYKEVKHFVEMMSIAAGESAYEVDRVARFEACCQSFSPIIFDLKEDSGFKEFAEACKKTADVLKVDEEIIENLVSFYVCCMLFVKYGGKIEKIYYKLGVNISYLHISECLQRKLGVV